MREERRLQTTDVIARISGHTMGRLMSSTHTEIREAMTDSPKYQCNICGYVYDPAVGDPSQSIEAGTPFEELPEDWTCPECGAGKEEFTQL
jgi:rubredoxin